MTFQAKIIADSVSAEGKRITTMQLSYPRFIHAEGKTHRILSLDSENEVFSVTQSTGLMDDRDLSRNASSSRAIPVAKMIEQVRSNPAKPIHWGKNQPGMQAAVELEGEELEMAKSAWFRAAWLASNIAEEMAALGVHKQVVNRILEPFQWISVIVTATEWDNFFELRIHKDAQPEIKHLAELMKQAMDASTPKLLKEDEWHLPYVTDEDIIDLARTDPHGWLELAKKVSAARCCRVSYLKHDGTPASLVEELALCDRLAAARPIHASPFEHQATPDTFRNEGDLDDGWLQASEHGNFVGWIQYRKAIEASFAK